MQEQILIQKAGQQDLFFLEKGEKELFSDSWSKNMLGECLENIRYEVLIGFWVLSSEERIAAGYLIGRSILEEGELLRLGCCKRFQNHGIASALLSFWLETGNKKEAFLEVRSQNRAARSLYEKFGFIEEGRRKGYYHNPDDDAILMKKKLP